MIPGEREARRRAAALVGLLAVASLASPLRANEMTGAHFAVRASTVNGGGAIEMQDEAATIVTRASVGQSSPLGLRRGPAGERIESGGFWTIDGGPIVLPLSCAGDCDGDDEVTVAEIIRFANIALDAVPAPDCTPLGRDAGTPVSIDEIVAGVRNALEGCQ